MSTALAAPVPASAAARSAPAAATVLRRCACGGKPGLDGECEQCRTKRLGLQRSAVSAGPALAPSSVHRVLASPGRPLDATTRAFMEPRFGHSFADVRVHADSQAEDSARAVGARAYAVGRHVVFASGAYAPGTAAGRLLLAHELAHVVQQRGTAAELQPSLEVGALDDPAEREAEAMADRVVAGARVGAPRLRRAAVQRLGDVAQRPAGLTCPVPPGSPHPIVKHFLFGEEDAVLTAAQKSDIATFAASWHAGGGVATVRVDGFASTDGPEGRNWQISCERAEAVVRELTAPLGGGAGIPAARITFFAHGESTDFGSALSPNRRATISSTTPAPAPKPPPSPAPPPGCTAATNPDLSGTAHNPTTDSEAAVVAKHPIDAFTANSAANDAIAAAGASGLAGPHLGPFDAFRHCVWNCLMTQRLSAARAEQFATGHENSGPSPISFDNQMDLHNNATGRSLATPTANCETVCMTALTAGQLRTIRGPHTSPPATPPVPTDCIGASSQPWP